MRRRVRLEETGATALEALRGDWDVYARMRARSISTRSTFKATSLLKWGASLQNPSPLAGGTPASPRTHRPVAVEPGVPMVPVYDRAALAVGQQVAGPVIIEERETTLVVLRGWVASVHETGAVIAERNP